MKTNISWLSIYFIIMILKGCVPSKVTTTDFNSKKLITVKGKIEISKNYCGGVAPTEEMLQEEKKKKPFVDYKLYVRAGRKNDINAPIIDSTMTNENGEFEFQLKKGEYVIISSNQKNKDIFKKYQNNKDYSIEENYLECMEKWWQDGITQLAIENQHFDDLYFHFTQRCFHPLNIYCMSFRGPMPP